MDTNIETLINENNSLKETINQLENKLKLSEELIINNIYTYIYIRSSNSKE